MAVLPSNRVAMVAAEINKALIGAVAADAARSDCTERPARHHRWVANLRH